LESGKPFKQKDYRPEMSRCHASSPPESGRGGGDKFRLLRRWTKEKREYRRGAKASILRARKEKKRDLKRRLTIEVPLTGRSRGEIRSPRKKYLEHKRYAPKRRLQKERPAWKTGQKSLRRSRILSPRKERKVKSPVGEKQTRESVTRKSFGEDSTKGAEA